MPRSRLGLWLGWCGVVLAIGIAYVALYAFVIRDRARFAGFWNYAWCPPGEDGLRRLHHHYFPWSRADECLFWCFFPCYAVDEQLTGFHDLR